MKGEITTIIPIWYPWGLQIESIKWLYNWYPELFVGYYVSNRTTEPLWDWDKDKTTDNNS